MQLTLVTGLSGSGKSIAIRQLEDSGCYCIDNLPAEFLQPVAESLAASGTQAAAVAIDARSHATFDRTLEALSILKNKGFDIRVLFLTASSEELVRRFSETRRRHPLSTHAQHLAQEVTLQEAIREERELLEPVSSIAHVMDTTGLLPSQLRRWVQQFIGEPEAKLTLTFESFAFKHGIPIVADLVFDVRCLPNPYYIPALRPLTGRDKPIIDYLNMQPLVGEMINDIAGYIEKWLPHFKAQNRHYLTVCIGCTGGQHRSVFVAEALGKHFSESAAAIVRHRMLESMTFAGERKAQTA